MPTYNNPTTTQFNEGGVIIAPSETKYTPKTLTEIQIELPAVVAGLGLEEVTEAGSGATGRIFWIDGKKIGLVEVDGTFTGEAALTADVTGALGTPAEGDLVVELTRTAATDFYTTTSRYQLITAVGAETKDVYLQRSTTWLMVLYGNAALSIKNGETGDMIVPLRSGYWQDRCEQRYQHLKLVFEGAGTCEVLEFDSDFNPASYSDFAGGGGSSDIGGAYDSATESLNTTVLNDGPSTQIDSTPLVLDSAPLDLTTVDQRIGVADIDTAGAKNLKIRLAIDANNSTGIQISIKDKPEVGSNYEPPYDPNKWRMRNTTLAADESYRTLPDGIDSLYVIDIDLDNSVPAVAVYIKATVVGATAGQVDWAEYTHGY